MQNFGLRERCDVLYCISNTVWKFVMRRPLAIALITAVAATALAACSRDRVEDAGPQGSRNFAVGDFTKIAVAGPYDVRVVTGGKPGVSATGPQNILDRMVVEVDGESLEIHPERKGLTDRVSFGKHAPVIVQVTTAALAGAAIAGSGDINVDKITGDSFDGKIAGSGSLTLGAVDLKALTISIGGSGDVRGQGKAARADYRIAGSGDIQLPNVQTNDLEVSIAGSGNVAAHASGTAKVNIVGSGDVRVTGGAKCDVSKAGSGDVVCS